MSALLVVAGAVGGYLVGVDDAPSETAATRVKLAARAEAQEDAARIAAGKTRDPGARRGLAVGRREGVEDGHRAGTRAGGTAVADKQAELAAAAEAARLADAADSAYEDDGGAYDPTPPSAGFYPDFEAFCADQPEETECGGAGDPAPG